MMNSSNLALLIFGCALTLFVLSQFAKRRGANNQALQVAVKSLSLITLGLAAFYFYQKYVG
jgi:hypothetical protein